MRFRYTPFLGISDHQERRNRRISTVGLKFKLRPEVKTCRSLETSFFWSRKRFAPVQIGFAGMGVVICWCKPICSCASKPRHFIGFHADLSAFHADVEFTHFSTADAAGPTTNPHWVCSWYIIVCSGDDQASITVKRAIHDHDLHTMCSTYVVDFLAGLFAQEYYIRCYV
jgi:hypothetical protein